MLTTQTKTIPTSYPYLHSTPASKPVPSQEEILFFVNAYTAVVALFLSTSPQHLWDDKQTKCADRLQIIRKLLSNPPPPFHPDWKIYYECVTAVLRNPRQPIPDIFQFSRIIQRHRDDIKHLESLNTEAEAELIQLLDNLDNPSDPDAHSRAIDAQLALLDDFDKRIDTTKKALMQYAGV